MEESLNARFNHNGPKIYKTKEKKRLMWRENNHRNVDVYNELSAKSGYRDVDPNFVLENIQSDIINSMVHQYEDWLDLKKEEDQAQKNEELTELEFKHLLKSGATIPIKMLEYYKIKYPKLFQSRVDANNKPNKCTKSKKNLKRGVN